MMKARRCVGEGDAVQMDEGRGKKNGVRNVCGTISCGVMEGRAREMIRTVRLTAGPGWNCTRDMVLQRTRIIVVEGEC